MILALPAVGRGRYVVGLLLGLLPLLWVLGLAPAATADNLFFFNLIRPADSTSWLVGMPGSVSLLVRLVGLAVLLAVGLCVWRQPPSPQGRLGALVAGLVVLLLSAGVCHTNYLLWLLPFLAVLVAGLAVAPPSLADGAPAPSGARSAAPD